MKKYLILMLIAMMTMACNNNKEIEWLGSYSNDTITFIFKENGICDVITAKTKLQGCDYSLDVNKTNVCVVDADQNIHLLEMHDGYMISQTNGSKFTKIK